MKYSIVTLFLPLSIVAACVSSTVPDTPVQASTASPASVPQTGLAAQTLEVGECGLFLWKLSGEPTFVFFSKAATDQATMLIESQEAGLAQTGAGGDIFGQFMTRTEWTSSSTGHAITVDLEPGEMLIEGQRVSSGNIKLTDEQGWETIMPVAGVRACMNQPDTSLPSLP